LDNNRNDSSRFTTRAAILGLMTALTVVFTYLVRIPVAPTRGYLNFGDVAIYFTALTFGPWTALITGGLGTALADILAGYTQWAPLTFLAHGLQGLAAGLIFRLIGRKSGESASFRAAALVFTFLAGSAVMMGLYFLFGSFMVGPGAAAAEIPGNLLQNLAGILIGTLLWTGVRKAYPPVSRYRW